MQHELEIKEKELDQDGTSEGPCKASMGTKVREGIRWDGYLYWKILKVYFRRMLGEKNMGNELKFASDREGTRHINKHVSRRSVCLHVSESRGTEAVPADSTGILVEI